MMTKNGARKILADEHIRIANSYYDSLTTSIEDAEKVDHAIEELIAPNEIAQAIRDAAVNWPPRSPYWDLEDTIVEAFWDINDNRNWHGDRTKQTRTWMLLVAEALES